MRRIVLWNIGLLVALIVVLSAKIVLASCGSANCFLVTGTQEGIASTGQIVIDLSYRWIPMDQSQEGSHPTSEGEEIRTNNELAQFDLSYGLTERFSLALTIPFLNNRRHEHLEGTEFSNTDGTTGFGDIRLIGKYALWVSTKHLLVGGLGIKTPTGEYKLLDNNGAINEATIQPGTGSWDGIASLYYTYQIIPHQFDAFFSTTYQANTENPLDYRLGNIFLLNAGVSYRSLEKARISLQVNARQAPHDEFEGAKAPNTGGRWIYLTPGVTLQATPNTALYTHVQLPIYQEVNEVNIVPRYGFIFGVSHVF